MNGTTFDSHKHTLRHPYREEEIGLHLQPALY